VTYSIFAARYCKFAGRYYVFSEWYCKFAGQYYAFSEWCCELAEQYCIFAVWYCAFAIWRGGRLFLHRPVGVPKPDRSVAAGGKLVTNSIHLPIPFGFANLYND
jgi:hypothetical protein